MHIAYIHMVYRNRTDIPTYIALTFHHIQTIQTASEAPLDSIHCLWLYDNNFDVNTIW